MVVNGIKLNFSKIVNNEIEKEINIVLTKSTKKYDYSKLPKYNA